MNRKGNSVAWLIALGGVWLWTFNQLAVAWRSYPNYEFGYVVPLVAIYLAWQRLRESSVKRNERDGMRIGAVLTCIVVIAWICFLLAELLRRVNPHWRMVSWVMIGSATLLTGVWLYTRGGRRLVATMAFPVAFTWVALPWPVHFEASLTLSLKDIVTVLTTELLNIAGVPAVRQGNVIELATGHVGVDAACSGITSLQSSLMAALFLGEFFRFHLAKRIVLVVAGAVIAMCGNIIRAFLLARVVDAHGEATLASYHDPLGQVETIAIFVAVAFLAWLISPRAPTRGAISGDAWRHLLYPSPSPTREGYVVFVAFLSIPLLASIWFALSPGGAIKVQDRPLLTLTTQRAANVRAVELTARERDLLRYTEAQALSVRDSAGREADIYHFFWKTEGISPTMPPYFHTPDVCMTLAGWEQGAQPVPAEVRVNGVTLKGKLFQFERGGRKLLAFQAIWYGEKPVDDPHANPRDTRGSRLALLWKGPRRSGMEVVSMFFPMVEDRAAQIRAAEMLLGDVLISSQ